VRNWDREADDRATEHLRWNTWTDTTDNHKMEAKFNGVASAVVKLTKRDGSEITIPIENLADADRTWITNWAKIKDAALRAMPPAVYLADLKPKSSTASAPKADWPPLAARSFYAPPDESVAGQGKPCYSLLVHDLPQGYQLLTGEAAIGDIPDKTVRDKHRHDKKVRGATASPLVFQILGDGHLLWSSKPLHNKNESESFLVDITRIGELQLRVDCSGDAGNARAVWKDVVLRRNVATILASTPTGVAPSEKKSHHKH